MSKHNREIDPDFFDVLVQSLSVLSNVAVLASTWIVARQGQDRRHSEQVIDSIRNQLRDLRRNLEDCFDSVEDILRILETAHGRSGANLLQERPRFGIGVLLQQDELMQAFDHLHRLDMKSVNARQGARSIQMTIANADLPGTENIVFDVDVFNADLNSILFDSNDFADAMAKLRSASRRAEDFVNNIYVALRRN